jgi:hypothetical protein
MRGSGVGLGEGEGVDIGVRRMDVDRWKTLTTPIRKPRKLFNTRHMKKSMTVLEAAFTYHH